MDKIIDIKDLNKSFGKIHAVNALSFSVRRGELFAFLGVNGAGKSTTISIMCGVLTADSGEVTVCGKDIIGSPKSVAQSLGVVFQNSVLDQTLTVRDNLESRAALYSIRGKAFESRYAELSQLLGLDELEGRAVGKLSGGQRRRADIARALINRPELLVLDEPTTGLDPQTRKLLWDVISNLRRQEGMTVFLTTHYMEEAADADYVVILDSGKICAEGTPLELKNQYTGDFITLYGADLHKLETLGLEYKPIRDGVRISVKDTAEAAALIAKHPELFLDFEITKGKMDDVFLAATGKKPQTA